MKETTYGYRETANNRGARRVMAATAKRLLNPGVERHCLRGPTGRRRVPVYREAEELQM